MIVKQLLENNSLHLRHLLFIALILRGCFMGTAQTSLQMSQFNHFPPHRFLVYNSTDGLPGNIISNLAIDKEGFMWVATNNGLARYDGQRFISFNSLVGVSDLPQSNIITLFVDSHNNLWVRFFTQVIYCIDLQTYKVRFVSKDYTDIANTSFSPFFTEDKAGNIWFNDAKSMVNWLWKDNKFETYPFFPKYPNKSIVRVCKGIEDYLWVATNDGIYRFDTQKKTYEKEQALSNLTFRVWTLTTDEAGNLWFCNWYNAEVGIVCYDPKQRQIRYKINKQMISPDANTDTHQILPLGKIVWFATNSSGLIAFDTETNRFNVYDLKNKTPLSIQTNTTVCIKNDKQGNLWLGTINGLHLIQAHRKETQLLAHNPFYTNSLISPISTCVLKLDDRKMVLGTLSGMSIYDRIDKTFRNINLPLYNGNDYNNNINALALGKNGSFWVGTWSGLFRLDKNTGSILEYYITFVNAGDKHPASVMHKEVGAIKALYTDKKGTLWFINQNNELGRMVENRPKGVFEVLKPLIQDADDKNDLFNCLLEFDDYLFLGTENGIVQYDYNRQSFQALPITFLEHKGNVAIANLERSGDFLLATVNGKPYKVNLATREATLLVNLDNQHKCQRIVDAQEGGIWLIEENGLLRTDINGSTAVFYDSKHYLNDNTFQWSAEYQMDKDADGNLYWGGSKGFTVIKPVEMLYNAPKPDVKITSIRHNNKPIALDEAIHLISAIRLPYDQRSFSLEFSALGSTIPDLNQFAYRFNGEQWVNLGNQSNVNFSNLEPGTYHLQVKAANSDGVWNEEGTRLTITILPPWYRSWLAWLFYLATMGYGIYRYYQYQLRRKMELSETRRLKELDTLKTRFYANVSHELRTPLTLMLAPLSTVLKSGGLDNRNFTLVRLAKQNAQGLLKLVNEILDLNKLEAKKMELKAEKTAVYSLIRRIVANFESAAEIQDIYFNFDYQADPYLQLMLDNDKFEKVLNNLLSNAVKFTPTQGNVTVTVKEVNNLLSITVTDTGRGIHPDDLPHIFNRFYQSNQTNSLTEGGTGIGLSLSAELVKLMDGTLHVQSAIGKGSTFIFELPKKEVLGTLSDVEFGMSDEGLSEISNPKSDITTPSVVEYKKERNEQGKTLLIVEDNKSLRDYLTLILEPYYQILKAENGRVALDILEKDSKPDLILSDVMMPIMDGFQLLSAIKTSDAFCTIPVVMLTARADSQDKLKALRIGVDDYLIKPFEEEELLVRIENLLKNAQNRQVVQQELLVSNISISDDFEGNKATASEIPTPLSIDDQKWLADLETMLRDNISDYNLSTDRMAEMLFISRAQFYRRVRTLTGLTPIEYLQEVRFNYARSLLEQRTVSSVKAAAAAVGMRQVQNFSQHFKERFGKSPSEYLT